MPQGHGRLNGNASLLSFSTSSCNKRPLESLYTERQIKMMRTWEVKRVKSGKWELIANILLYSYSGISFSNYNEVLIYAGLRVLYMLILPRFVMTRSSVSFQTKSDVIKWLTIILSFSTLLIILLFFLLVFIFIFLIVISPMQVFFYCTTWWLSYTYMYTFFFLILSCSIISD